MQYVRQINCARGCGYYRPYTDDQNWFNLRIDHPLYGIIRQDELVRLEVWNHRCDAYLDAIARAAERRERNGYKIRK